MQYDGDCLSSREPEVNVADLFEVLSSSRRRFVLGYLQSGSKSAAVADVATALTAWETDAANSDDSKEGARSRYAALYHLDIPKMVEKGIIEWNRDRNTITLHEAWEPVLADGPLALGGDE